MASEQLPHLETFAAAAERSSFTAAARELQLTQAAVSQRIQQLEKELGTSLFERRGGRVLLSEAGQRLYAYAQRILGLHEEARRAVTGQRAQLRGELVLAASSVPGEHLLPTLLADLRKKHPHLHVRLTVADTKVVLDLVENGQAHLGFVGGKSDSPHLEYRCFACDTLVLVVPGKHAWARKRSVPLEQVLAQPLILREPGSGSRWCFEQALRHIGRTPGELQVALEVGSNEGIKEAVQRGLGLAILSRHAIAQELRSGRLRALTIAGLPLAREIFVAWDRRRVLPIPARLFLDLLEPCPRKKKP
jgi:DNA-binding transcriptional LysR family regulator